jgi:hypothetical protein
MLLRAAAAGDERGRAGDGPGQVPGHDVLADGHRPLGPGRAWDRAAFIVARRGDGPSVPPPWLVFIIRTATARVPRTPARHGARACPPVIQYAGRLHRKQAGKSEVRIHDYRDSKVSVLARMLEKRLRAYRAMGYEEEVVEAATAADGPVVEYEESDV